MLVLVASPALAAGNDPVHIEFAPTGEPGAFNVTITGISEDVTSVTCKIWCELSDAKDYAATRTADGTWNLGVSSVDHNYRAGTYRLAVWVSEADGAARVVGTSAAEVSYDTTGALVALPVDENAEHISLRLVNATLPERCPVWFRAWPVDNPSDFRTYFGFAQEDRSYTGTMVAARHTDAGSYVVTAYAGTAPVAWTRVELPGCSSAYAATEMVNSETGAFRIRAEADAPSGVRTLTAAVWTLPDKSDLVLYDMQETEGSWIADVSPASHGYRSGTYKIEVRAELGNGLRALAFSRTHECVLPRSASVEYLPDGTCEVVLRSSGLAPGTLIDIPTWTEENGLDDLYRYSAEVDAEGTVRCEIDPALHSASSAAFRTQFRYAGELLGETGYEVQGVAPLSVHRIELNRARRAVYDEVGYDLHSVYLWTVDTISYVPRPWQKVVPSEYASREEWYAVEGFQTHSGDCFVYTAVFAELARGLGYDAQYVEGYVWSVRGLWADHGFVVIHQDGRNYICDPELQHVSSKPRNLFMQPADAARAKYKW